MPAYKNSSMKQYIEEYSTDQIKYDDFYDKEVMKTARGPAVINFNSRLVKYFSELKGTVQRRDFTDEEYHKYRFNPKVLSFDLYGTTELWSSILELNEMKHISEFDVWSALVYDASIMNIIPRILDLEQDAMDINEAYVNQRLIECS